MLDALSFVVFLSNPSITYVSLYHLDFFSYATVYIAGSGCWLNGPQLEHNANFVDVEGGPVENMKNFKIAKRPWNNL